MASLTEQIMAKIVTQLTADGGPSPLTVNRERYYPSSRQELPMISVYPMHEDVTRIGGSRSTTGVERDLHIQVRHRATGDAAAVDPLRVWVVSQLIARLSLDTLAIDVEEVSTDWEHEDATDGGYEAAITTFKVHYATKAADLTSKL